MLVLKVNIGQLVRLFDQTGSCELGTVKRLKPHPGHPNEVYLGFELLPTITILRDSLVNGKEATNDIPQVI